MEMRDIHVSGKRFWLELEVKKCIPEVLPIELCETVREYLHEDRYFYDLFSGDLRVSRAQVVGEQSGLPLVKHIVQFTEGKIGSTVSCVRHTADGITVCAQGNSSTHMKTVENCKRRDSLFVELVFPTTDIRPFKLVDDTSLLSVVTEKGSIYVGLVDTMLGHTITRVSDYVPCWQWLPFEGGVVGLFGHTHSTSTCLIDKTHTYVSKDGAAFTFISLWKSFVPTDRHLAFRIDGEKIAILSYSTESAPVQAGAVAPVPAGNVAHHQYLYISVISAMREIYALREIFCHRVRIDWRRALGDDFVLSHVLFDQAYKRLELVGARVGEKRCVASVDAFSVADAAILQQKNVFRVEDPKASPIYPAFSPEYHLLDFPSSDIHEIV